jgi:CubicO group peptidase (beta-lactamase class C family)
MKSPLVIFLICLLTSSANAQSQTRDSLTDAISFIDAWVDAQQAFDHLPGISVAIVKDQKLLWSKGYGVADLKKNTRNTPGTVFSICSISKLFTSIAIMQLWEKGKLRLDDSVSSLLPSFNIRQRFKDSGPITVRGLLTHSSGMPRESDFPYWSGPEFHFPTQNQVDEKLGQQQTLYPASTYFQYSNLGMIILGEIVEKVSGKPYDVYVEENILKPLRLANTHPYLPAAGPGAKVATGYSSIKRDGTRDPIPPFDTKALHAADGYSSTVEDLAAFASWQFRLLHTGGSEILKASTLKEMQRAHWVDPDWKIYWGLGFAIYQQNGKTLVGHYGTCPGYRTILLMEPDEDLAYIVMINAMESPAVYANQIRNIIAKAEKEKGGKLEGVNLEQYTGRYNAQPWGSEMSIISWYGNLAIVDLPSDTPLERMSLLQHVKDDVFRRIRRDDKLGEEVTFERDKKTGKVIKMWNQSNFSLKLD